MGDQISLTSSQTLVLCYSRLFIPLKYLLFDQVFFIDSSRGQISSGGRHCTGIESRLHDVTLASQSLNKNQ